MIDTLLDRLNQGKTYVTSRPSLVIAFVLVAIIPIVFLYSGQQFLEAGRANQDKLQRDRLGLLHDSLVQLLHFSEYDVTVIQSAISEIKTLNADITNIRVVKQTGTDFFVIASGDESEVGAQEEQVTIYQSSAVRFNESLIFPYFIDGERYWQAVRSSQANDGTFYYIFTEQSFKSIDNYFAQSERSAYWLLGLVYLGLLLLAVWQVKQIDYQLLYAKLKKDGATRDQFTQSVVHELRTPLTAIRGYSSMIAEDNNMPVLAKEHAQKIQTSSERLLLLINDLLDVARLQSGKLKMQFEPIDLNGVVAAVVTELTPLANDRALTLTSHGKEVPYVNADSKRLHQILLNLASNALKYTTEGGVEIEMSATSTEALVRIKDTGAGIDAENQAKLFAPFFRVENAQTAEITGTGLGMWITKEIATQMNAKVAIESIKGIGTHVILRIPLVASKVG